MYNSFINIVATKNSFPHSFSLCHIIHNTPNTDNNNSKNGNMCPAPDMKLLLEKTVLQKTKDLQNFHYNLLHFQSLVLDSHPKHLHKNTTAKCIEIQEQQASCSTVSCDEIKCSFTYKKVISLHANSS